LAEVTSRLEEPHTTVNIASKLGFSQQTASRHLIELENQGMIKRERATRGETIQITEKGMQELNKMYVTLHRILEAPRKELTVEGEVFSGLGEGAYYVSQPIYMRQFQEKLGFTPFPGTLNVRLKRKHIKDRSLMDSINPIEIHGFKDGARSYGEGRCYRVMINEEVEGAVVVALRTHYREDVLEVLAPINLRERLKLKDGDTVKIRFIR
jgi:riboflavin kinase